MEEKMIAASIADRRMYYSEARLGQVFAFLITLSAMASGAYTALQGHELAGAALGGAGIGGIVMTFILGRQRKSNASAETDPSHAADPALQRKAKPK
jgi:hypothetical protein